MYIDVLTEPQGRLRRCTLSPPTKRALLASEKKWGSPLLVRCDEYQPDSPNLTPADAARSRRACHVVVSVSLDVERT